MRFHKNGNRLQWDYIDAQGKNSFDVNLNGDPPLLTIITATGFPETHGLSQMRELILTWIDSAQRIHIASNADEFTLTNDIVEAPVRVAFRVAPADDATIQKVARKIALLHETTKVVTVPHVKDILIEFAAAEEALRTPTVSHGAEAVRFLDERRIRILGNAELLSVAVWSEEESMALEVEMNAKTLGVQRSRTLREAHICGRPLPRGFVLTDLSEKEDERLIAVYDPGAKATSLYCFRPKGTWVAWTRSDEEQAMYIALMRAIKEW